MKTVKKFAPWVAAVALATAVGFAPVAGAATEQAPVVSTTQPAPGGADPLVPDGPDPSIPYQLGYIDPNHDNGNTTNGYVDLPS